MTKRPTLVWICDIDGEIVQPIDIKHGRHIRRPSGITCGRVQLKPAPTEQSEDSCKITATFSRK